MSAPRACALVAAALLAPCAQALVVRHDVDDGTFIHLASDYPATATFHPADDEDALIAMGTLIHPRWILTAAHVGETLHAGDRAEVGRMNVEIDRVVLSPGWQGFHHREDHQRDIALVHLKSAVTRVGPARIYTGDDEVGCLVTFVGRGSVGTGLTGPLHDTRVLRAATNRVEKAEGSGLQFRFDAPGDAGVTLLEGISGEGDSGGPAYCMRDGVTWLIGVSSSQDARPAGRNIGHYGVLEYYSRVSVFTEWILTTIASGSH
jgi:hypothetical protein